MKWIFELLNLKTPSYFRRILVLFIVASKDYTCALRCDQAKICLEAEDSTSLFECVEKWRKLEKNGKNRGKLRKKK